MTIDSGTEFCTTNFIFRDADNQTLFIGTAAHCLADGEVQDLDSCWDRSLPLGSEVEVRGTSRPGILVYSSYLAMEAGDESDPYTCLYNDFALIAIHPDDRPWVHPAVYGFGGPAGLATGEDVQLGSRALLFGNTSLRPRGELQRSEGYVTDDSVDGWGFGITFAPPGVPGDSGGPVLTADGWALGIQSTLKFAPHPGENGVVGLDRALAYARDVAGFEVFLATWPQEYAGRLPDLV